MRRHRSVAVLFILAAGCVAAAQSVYPAKLDDRQAVYVAPGTGDAAGNGVTDDTEALQHAIDKVADTSHQGIVFVASGRYRISRTVFIWPGIRLIGYGAQRPVITLGARTEGFGVDPAYMLFFAGARITPGSSVPSRRRPTTPFSGTVPATLVVDANPGTFYSALSNIDIEIGDDNPGAIAVRSHYAQHCFLAHMTFHLGSGLAGIDEAGNLAEDLHFEGGDFGIRTGKPSPGWQFTLLDSTFTGQRKAAIREHEAGLTLVNTAIRNVPEAISIDPGYAEELWVSNAEFTNISGPAISISNENNPRTEINLQHIHAKNVPLFARFRESGRTLSAPATEYHVNTLSHGLTLKNLTDSGSIQTTFDAKAGPGEGLRASPVLHEPSVQEPWANARDLGAIGDGTHDDTAALQAAIREHKTLYLPSGRYRITATLELRPDTVLFGLHPSATAIVLDENSPNFSGQGAPVAMLHAPQGGVTSLSGIGLYAGGTNTRASAVMWQAGEHSRINDVRFLGGHGTNNADGTRMNPYNANHTGDPDPRKQWDSQYPSLWVLNGGGGTFADIWTPDTFAQAGLMVSDTQTPGHVYELSSEHHVRNEIEILRSAHWDINALQTEEEWGEGGHALPLSIGSSKDILFTNFHSYRVVGSHDTLPAIAQIGASADIRFRNAHMDSDSKVAADNGVADRDTQAAERAYEFSNLDVTTGVPDNRSSASNAEVQRLVAGFYNISGSAVDAQGRLLFIDPKMQRIYRWSPASRGLELLRDAPLSATNLAVDKSGNVLVIAYEGDGTVYSFRPDAPLDQLEKLQPQPAAPHPNATAWLPNDFWDPGLSRNPQPAPKPFQFISRDSSIFIPAGADFVHGELYYGTKMADVLRSFALAPAIPGQRFYFTEEQEERTWGATVSADGTVTQPKLFAERGGESVTAGPDGNVYIAAGEILQYSPQGKLLKTIHTPERPINLIFGGPNHRTLFILARTSLYSWQLP